MESWWIVRDINEKDPATPKELKIKVISNNHSIIGARGIYVT